MARTKGDESVDGRIVLWLFSLCCCSGLLYLYIPFHLSLSTFLSVISYDGDYIRMETHIHGAANSIAVDTLTPPRDFKLKLGRIMDQTEAITIPRSARTPTFFIQICHIVHYE
jgi:hypothetical protein